MTILATTIIITILAATCHLAYMWNQEQQPEPEPINWPTINHEDYETYLKGKPRCPHCGRFAKLLYVGTHSEYGPSAEILCSQHEEVFMTRHTHPKYVKVWAKNEPQWRHYAVLPLHGVPKNVHPLPVPELRESIHPNPWVLDRQSPRMAYP